MGMGHIDTKLIHFADKVFGFHQHPVFEHPNLSIIMAHKVYFWWAQLTLHLAV